MLIIHRRPVCSKLDGDVTVEVDSGYESGEARIAGYTSNFVISHFKVM